MPWVIEILTSPSLNLPPALNPTFCRPGNVQALIGERDAYMARSILQASGQMTVAVVGMAHMDGIEKALALQGFAVSRPQVPCAPLPGTL